MIQQNKIHNKKDLLNSNFLWISIFITIYLIEFFLFKSYVALNIAQFYPYSFDQADYLKITYKIYEQVREEGLIKGLVNTSTANSILFIPQTVLFFLVFGASRFSALSVNFVYFILLQTSIIYLLRWISGQYYMSAILLGTLLSAGVFFNYVGSLIDFRIDFIALCLYGIFIAITIRSNIFLNRKWCIAAALVASFLILTRCLTSLYILLLIGSIFGYTLLSLLIAPAKIIDNKARIKNIFLFSFIIVLSTIPFLWIHRDFLYTYYITMGALKESSFRSLETQTTNLMAIIKYYPHSILSNHLGKKTLYLIGFLCIISISYLLISKSKKSLFNSSIALKEKFFSPSIINFFLVMSCIIPIIILTIYPTKSPVVGSITITPIILFFILNCTVILMKIPQNTKILFILAIIFLLAGVHHWIKRTQKNHTPLYRVEANNINKMYDDIGQYIETAQWTKTMFSSDQVIDYLAAAVLMDLYYERHKILLTVYNTPLGASAFPIPEPEAKQLLINSDVYITNDQEYPISVYPFNISMKSIRPSLNQTANQNFVELGVYHYKKFNLPNNLHVYVKPDFNISGILDNSISTKGLLLTIPHQVVNRASQFNIAGNSTIQYLESTPLIVELDNSELNMPVHAKLIIANNQYHISLVIPNRHQLTSGNLHIRLKFPREIQPKIFQDQEKTTLAAPASKNVILASLS